MNAKDRLKTIGLLDLSSHFSSSAGSELMLLYMPTYSHTQVSALGVPTFLSFILAKFIVIWISPIKSASFSLSVIWTQATRNLFEDWSFKIRTPNGLTNTLIPDRSATPGYLGGLEKALHTSSH